jgi:hypothetical protein
MDRNVPKIRKACTMQLKLQHLPLWESLWSNYMKKYKIGGVKTKPVRVAFSTGRLDWYHLPYFFYKILSFIVVCLFSLIYNKN